MIFRTKDGQTFDKIETNEGVYRFDDIKGATFEGEEMPRKEAVIKWGAAIGIEVEVVDETD